MKTTFTLLFILIASFSFSQRVMIEAGGIVLKGYDPGINGGVSVIVTPKSKGKTQSGAGFGIELYKTNELPIGIPIFARGVLRADNGLMVSLQAGYMFMNQTFDDGTVNLAGLYSKLGVGFSFNKPIYVLLNFTGAMLRKEFAPGGSLMIGVKF